jgi:hypothetical protein
MPNKVPTEPYYPGNLPDTLPGLIQFLYDELWRISTAIRPFPISNNVQEVQAGIPVDTTETQFRLFEDAIPSLTLPGGQWDILLGEWTAPANGIYQININNVIEPFGTGNKDYAARLHIYVNDVEIWTNTATGADNFILSCALAVSGRLLEGDVMRCTIGLVHEQFTGVTTVTSFWTLFAAAVQ